MRCVEGARILGTTVSKLYANRLFDGMKFDVVMFDEVSMAYVPQIVCAAMYATQRLLGRPPRCTCPSASRDGTRWT